MTTDGYPTDDFLEHVRTYDVLKNGPCDLIRELKEFWRWPDYIRWYPRTKTLKISTGGWSGHENVMAALQENFIFMIFWMATLRGGHYTFKLHEIDGCDWKIRRGEE